MKKLILSATLAAMTLINSTSHAYESVRGYIRSNGTVVSPYIRSSGDGNPYNNLSSSLVKRDQNQYAYVRVNGYIKNNGTYVSPHIRSNPDSYKWNNLSSMQDIKVINSPFVPKRVASNLKVV